MNEHAPEEPKKRSIERHRDLQGFYKWYARAITVFGVLLSVIAVFKIVIYGYVMQEVGYFAAIVGAFLPLTFLFFPATKKAPQDRVPWYDLIFALICILGPIYVFIYAMDITVSGWAVSPPLLAKILAFSTWVLVIEAVRRTGGVFLASFILIISAYPLFAHVCPGILMARKYSFSRVLGFHFLGGQSIFGLPTQVFSRLLIGYMLFAVTLRATGAAEFFINFCLSVMGRVRGGAAKVSILSSASFATMSGSVIANVVTTGSITIPTMKRLGYPAYYAAAIEACASKGGTLTPPVMGIVAFVMADFTGFGYAEVCIAAFLPVILYWTSLFVQTDFYAAKTGLKGISREELPSFFQTIKEGWYYPITLAVLVYFIFFQRVEYFAPYYATAVHLVIVNFHKENRLSIDSIVRLIDGTGKILTELLALLAGVGMIIGALSITGTAHGFSSALTRLGGENLLLMLCLGAITSFILGIGLPSAPCYIFLAMLLAPAMVDAGVYEMAAHLFLVYWGAVSFITPPVALASYAAAGIAQADPIKTSFHSVKLGFVSLLVPFFFVYNPALVGYGSLTEIIEAMFTSLVGIILLSAGFEGYCFFLGKISPIIRILFSFSGLLMFHAQIKTDFIGFVIAGLTIILDLIYKHYKAKVSNLPKSVELFRRE